VASWPIRVPASRAVPNARAPTAVFESPFDARDDLAASATWDPDRVDPASLVPTLASPTLSSIREERTCLLRQLFRGQGRSSCCPGRSSCHWATPCAVAVGEDQPNQSDRDSAPKSWLSRVRAVLSGNDPPAPMMAGLPWTPGQIRRMRKRAHKGRQHVVRPII
jgi:hypothetical protein